MQRAGPPPRGSVALITTERFRTDHNDHLRTFVYGNLYTVSKLFKVSVTGGTYKHLVKIIERNPDDKEMDLIEQDTRIRWSSKIDINHWRKVVLSGLDKKKPGIRGMIEVGYSLVEGKLGGILHFVDWSDMNAKADTAVLWREANVHNIPIALDTYTAETFVQKWCERFNDPSNAQEMLEVTSQKSSRPLRGIKRCSNVVALIAHDNKKLDLCRFAVENSDKLFKYDWILATGTTGRWLNDFMAAMGHTKKELKKIRPGNSGPYGGDVQIAYAVTTGLCQTVFFFQDPQVSHPHDADIRLFEQATVSVVPRARLATNTAAARLLLGT
ncbi:MAG: methylglyoxal synthase [Syntrophales bacterium]